jgi:hypothetical protein
MVVYLLSTLLEVLLSHLQTVPRNALHLLLKCIREILQAVTRYFKKSVVVTVKCAASWYRLIKMVLYRHQMCVCVCVCNKMKDFLHFKPL